MTLKTALDPVPQDTQNPQLSDEDLEALIQQEESGDNTGTGEMTRLQRAYEKNSNPDRLRVVNDAGQFYDVIVMGDSIGLQPVTFVADYTQVIEYHNDFNTAQEMLDMVVPGWYTHSGITASTKKFHAKVVNSRKKLTYVGALCLLAAAIIEVGHVD